jgi:hypothetical protein
MVHDRMVLGIVTGEAWTRLLTESGFGLVVIAEQSGRDMCQAIAV